MKRIICTSVLPGEPLDGSGKGCIHLILKDEMGPFVEPHVLHQKLDEAGQPIRGQLIAKPTRCRLACDPRRNVAPVIRGNNVTITERTDDPRAVTCPKCKVSKFYTDILAQVEKQEI